MFRISEDLYTLLPLPQRKNIIHALLGATAGPNFVSAK
jgi:hypothetical protein